MASFSPGGAALGALFLLACEPFGTPTGQLGNGQFSYECASGSVDTACSGAGAGSGVVDPITGATTTLPSVLAVGSRFTIDYASLVDGTGSVQGVSGYLVSPASSRLAEVDGTALLARRAGYLALLASGPGTGSVEDFVFVRLADIATLTPDRSVVSLPAGGTDTLSVTASDDASALLAGRLGCAWTVTQGPDKVSTQGPTDGASVSIAGLADGDATVSVVCSGHEAQVTVHVAGGVAVGDGGLPDGDGGSSVTEGGTHG